MMANHKSKRFSSIACALLLLFALALLSYTPLTAHAALGASGIQDAESQAALDGDVETQATSNASARATALKALEQRLDDMRTQLYVYKDFSDSMNHFTQKSMMWGKYQSRVKTPNENC